MTAAAATVTAAVAGRLGLPAPPARRLSPRTRPGRECAPAGRSAAAVRRPGHRGHGVSHGDDGTQASVKVRLGPGAGDSGAESTVTFEPG